MSAEVQLQHTQLNNVALNKKQFNNDLTTIDNTLIKILKDIEENVKYLKVVTQAEYNTTFPRNDTLYFINNVTDEIYEINGLLDVGRTSNNKIWMLTVSTKDDGETQLELWQANVNTGPFQLKKILKNYVDGRITFDGSFEYINSDNKTISFNTKGNPFVVAINDVGQLYAYPNIHQEPILLRDNQDGRVTVCSVEKGYCPPLKKGNDQGIVVVYNYIKDNGSVALEYQRYGYLSDDSTTKSWGGVGNIPLPYNVQVSKITYVAIRRLMDYRLAITYNYKDKQDGIIKGAFCYTNAIPVGNSLEQPVIEFPGCFPIVGPYLYGAVRNDGGTTIEKPYLVPIEEPIAREGTLEFKYSLADRIPVHYKDKVNKINLEALNTRQFKHMSDEESAWSNLKLEEILGLKVTNSYNYGLFFTHDDPELGDGAPSQAVILNARTEDGDLILSLQGSSEPCAEYSITPILNWEADIITLRYAGDQFKTETSSLNLLPTGKNISGWFALDSLHPINRGENRISSVGGERSTFTLVGANGAQLFLELETTIKQKTYSFLNFQLIYEWPTPKIPQTQLRKLSNIRESTSPTVTFSFEAKSASGTLKKVSSYEL